MRRYTHVACALAPSDSPLGDGVYDWQSHLIIHKGDTDAGGAGLTSQERKLLNLPHQWANWRLPLFSGLESVVKHLGGDGEVCSGLQPVPLPHLADLCTTSPVVRLHRTPSLRLLPKSEAAENSSASMVII